MKHFAYSILGCLLLSLNAAFAQKTWSFDGQDPLLSSDGKSLLNLYTIKEIPEFVTGVEGKALRTDGYSTWMDTTTEGDVSSLSGWFALESYPTDTAAFMGIRDMAGTSVAVCVDRYGELLLGMGQNGSYSYCSLKTKVDRFKWLHVVLDLSNESVCLNGRRMSAEVWPRNLQDGEMILRVGKDFREKKVWMYDVTAINGLIDGISLTPFSDDSSAWRDEIALGLKKTPVLAIPETRFAKDFNRPRYHLLPAANWTNETHGLLLYKGKYHIFNQKNAIQHGLTTVYEHSVGVAGASLKLAEFFHLKVNEKALIRGALLHDYFLYDWHIKRKGHHFHGFTHPATALRNAEKEYNLGDIERNIISRHMFPLTVVPPMCREAWLVCLADKYCAVKETFAPAAGY